MLRLEVGKYYWNKEGHVRGPISRGDDPMYPFADPAGYSYTGDGKFVIGLDDEDDNLVEEVTHFRLLSTNGFLYRTAGAIYRIVSHGLSPDDLPAVNFHGEQTVQLLWAYLTDIEWCKAPAERARVGDTVMCTQTNDVGALVLQGEYTVKEAVATPDMTRVLVEDWRGSRWWLFNDGHPHTPQYELLVNRRRPPNPTLPASVAIKRGDRVRALSTRYDFTAGMLYEVIRFSKDGLKVRVLNDKGEDDWLYIGADTGASFVGCELAQSLAGPPTFSPSRTYDEYLQEGCTCHHPPHIAPCSSCTNKLSEEEWLAEEKAEHEAAEQKSTREAELLKAYKHERTAELLRDVMFSDDMKMVSQTIKDKIEAVFDRLIHDQEFEKKRKDYDNARAVYTQHLNQANTLQEKKRELTAEIEILSNRKSQFEKEVIDLQNRILMLRDELPIETTSNGRKIQL